MSTHSTIDISLMQTTTHRALPFSPFTLAVILGFASTFLVNGLLVYAAVSSEVGLIEDNPYERGDLYEKSLVDQRAVARDGWQIEVTPTKENLNILFSNGKGSTNTITRVELIALRPDRRSPDIQQEATATGTAAVFQFPPLLPKGLWLIKLRFWDDGGEVFEIRRHIYNE
jgi:nitrogen fixation protein FixH